MKALAFGEVLWDVYPDEKYLGGAPLNFAAHLAKHGNEVFLLSAVGDDSLGREAISKLEEWDISPKYVSVLNDKETGKCLVTLDEKAVPSYNLLNDVAYDYISTEGEIEDFDVFYFGTLALRSEHNFKSLEKLLARQKFNDVFVDINIRAPHYSERSVRFALANATILKISGEELPLVAECLKTEYTDSYRDFAKALSADFKNLNGIIVTLGQDGAYYLDTTSAKEFESPAVPVKVASTVGAGDSFSAAFMHHIKAEGADASLRYASRVAGFVVSKYDAVPDYNTEDFS